MPHALLVVLRHRRHRGADGVKELDLLGRLDLVEGGDELEARALEGELRVDKRQIRRARRLLRLLPHRVRALHRLRPLEVALGKLAAALLDATELVVGRLWERAEAVLHHDEAVARQLLHMLQHRAHLDQRWPKGRSRNQVAGRHVGVVGMRRAAILLPGWDLDELVGEAGRSVRVFVPVVHAAPRAVRAPLHPVLDGLDALLNGGEPLAKCWRVVLRWEATRCQA